MMEAKDKLVEYFKNYKEQSIIENLKRLPSWIPENVRQSLAHNGTTLWVFENEARLQESREKSKIEKRLCTDKEQMQSFWNYISETCPQRASEILREISNINDDWKRRDQELDSDKKESLEKIWKALYAIRTTLQNSPYSEEEIERSYTEYSHAHHAEYLYNANSFRLKMKESGNYPSNSYPFYETISMLANNPHGKGKSLNVILSHMPSFYETIESMEKELNKMSNALNPKKKRKNNPFAKRRFFIKELKYRIIHGFMNMADKTTQINHWLTLSRVVLDDLTIEYYTLDDALKAKK